jgi:hypothetical protein
VRDRGLEDELVTLARLVLHGQLRDVELFVHRLAYRHRGTSLGARLAEIDALPAVNLRGGDVHLTIYAKGDRREQIDWLRRLADVLEREPDQSGDDDDQQHGPEHPPVLPAEGGVQ